MSSTQEKAADLSFDRQVVTEEETSVTFKYSNIDVMAAVKEV